MHDVWPTVTNYLIVLFGLWAMLLMLFACRDQERRDQLQRMEASIRVWARHSFHFMSSSVHEASLSLSDKLLRQHGAPPPLGVLPPKSMV